MTASGLLNKVSVLFDGFSRTDTDGSSDMEANCSCTLIFGEGLRIVVDTMTPWDGPRLVEALSNRGVYPDQVTHVVATHGHSDHIGNLNLFLKAKHIVGTSMNHGEKYYDVLQNGASLKLGDGIEVIPTPGHTASCVTVVVQGAYEGTVAITGDLFEKREDIFEPHIWEHLAGSENPLQQAQNRHKVLGMADYIVPGHGPMFQVTEEMRIFHDDLLRTMRLQYAGDSSARGGRPSQRQGSQAHQAQEHSDSRDGQRGNESQGSSNHASDKREE